jgi:hypothetical protein
MTLSLLAAPKNDLKNENIICLLLLNMVVTMPKEESDWQSGLPVFSIGRFLPYRSQLMQVDHTRPAATRVRWRDAWHAMSLLMEGWECVAFADWLKQGASWKY